MAQQHVAHIYIAFNLYKVASNLDTNAGHKYVKSSNNNLFGWILMARVIAAHQGQQGNYHMN